MGLGLKFIPMLWLVAMVLAEPPVGDGYPSARSSHDASHDHHDAFPGYDVSPGVTAASSRSAAGYEYPGPGGRGSPGAARSPPATVRVSYTQRFTAAARAEPAGRQRAASAARRAPAARAPAVSARTLSTQYGMPDARSAPSQEYGAPLTSSRRSHSNTNTASRPHSHFTPSDSLSRSQASKTSDHDAPRSSFGARNAPSDKYGIPSSRSALDASARSDSAVVDSVSQTYGVPNQRTVSDTYGAPNPRSLSEEQVTPATRNNRMGDDGHSFASASSRSSPSSTYLPASRGAPSEQYGPPEQRDSSQGYDYSSRARALEELLQQEPASYDFGYQIEDAESGSDFGHTETREENRAEGSYFVVLPDGTKQTVEYEADERGFKPRISVQPAGGYDGNAQDGARAAQGPY